MTIVAGNNADLLRIGVLGCGQISQAAHFEAIKKAERVGLFAICDLAPDLLDRMSTLHQPERTYISYEEMLADPDIDAIVVAIADQFHVEASGKALAAGKHVLVEKPMGVTVEEAAKLAKQATASDLVVQVGNMKRFDPGIAFAHDFITTELGEMLALKAWYCDSTYRYAMTDNLQPIIESSLAAHRPAGNPKANRPRYLLLGHGSHLVDTARYLGGPIEAVRTRRVEKFGAYCWFSEIRFASGALGHLDLTVAVRMDWHEGFQVYGEHGSVIGKIYNPWYLKSADVECFSTRDSQYHRPLGEDADSYRLQIEGFASSIRSGEHGQAGNAVDGLAAVQAITAMSQSVESNTWVAIETVTGGP